MLGTILKYKYVYKLLHQYEKNKDTLLNWNVFGTENGVKRKIIKQFEIFNTFIVTNIRCWFIRKTFFRKLTT